MAVRYVTDNGEPPPYQFRARANCSTVLTTSLLKGSHMNYEISCPPVSSADVPGYRFTPDQNGALIARCEACRVGFLVRETNDAEVRQAMAAHRDLSHGCRAR